MTDDNQSINPAQPPLSGKTGNERKTSRYDKRIRNETVDVYDILNAFGVTNPATQHAIKKLLVPGQRHQKTLMQDMQEAHWSIARAIELEHEKNGTA